MTERQVELGCGLAVTVQVSADQPKRDAPLVLHLHGGAFQTGLSGCGGTVASLLAKAGAVVVSPDYPAGRAHPFPAALDISFAFMLRLYKERSRWAGRSSRLFVAGEESGGNLAAALALMARDRRGPPLAGQILLSPMLDAGLATCSIRTANAGPVGCKWADGWHDYLGAPEKASHPYASPAAASRLADLPPALVLTADDDPMRDESLCYAERLRLQGIAVRTHTIRGSTRWPDALCLPTQPANVTAPPTDLPVHQQGPWWPEVVAAIADFLASPTRTLQPSEASS